MSSYEVRPIGASSYQQPSVDYLELIMVLAGTHFGCSMSDLPGNACLIQIALWTYSVLLKVNWSDSSSSISANKFF